MTDNPINIAGIEVPSNSPLFLTILAVHVLLALVCVITGIVAMLSKKQSGRHPTFGAIYYWALSIVFVSATAISVMRWAEDYHLFVLGTLSFATATVGRAAMRRRWRKSVALHITLMSISYILLLTAFYVDNGKNLPLWRNLPPIAFWLLPSIVGIPLIARALKRYATLWHSNTTPRNLPG